MQKTFADLNIIQKLSIRIWNKRHMIHLSALRELRATDVVNIYTHELLFSYLSDPETDITMHRILEEHSHNYIMLPNVTFYW